MPTFEYQAEKTDGSLESGITFGTSLDQAARDLAAKGLRVTRIGLATSAQDPLAGVAAPRATVNQAPSPAPNVQPATPYVGPMGVEAPTGTPASRTPETASYEHPMATVKSQSEGPSTDPRSYAATSVWGPLMGKVPLKDLAFFFRQAGTMLEAGVPIVQAFTTLSRQSRSAKLSTIVTEIVGHVEAGRPISAGIQRYPEVFSPVVVSLVRAGEEGGFLDSSLHTVADYLDQEIALRNLYSRLTLYPKIQLVLSVLIIIGANAIITMMRPGARTLTSPLSEPSTWYWLGPLLVILFLFLRIGLANPRIKFNWDLVLSCVPYLGRTIRELSMARFGRAFGALYKGGVPMSKALHLSADACGNEYLRSRMYPAYRGLESGAGLTETLRGTGAFSPIVLDMVDTGERTGNLDQMLGKMAEFYVAEAEVRQTKMAYIVGAVIGLGVMIYLGYIIVNFWSGYGGDYQKMLN